MQSIWVYLVGLVLEGLLKLSYMKLGLVLVRLQQYPPPQAYCTIRKQVGSHPTESHKHMSRFANAGTRL